jgi:hypothetical protein
VAAAEARGAVFPAAEPSAASDVDRVLLGHAAKCASRPDSLSDPHANSGAQPHGASTALRRSRQRLCYYRVSWHLKS